MSTQTISVGANDWVYLDKSGAPHNVTTSEGFTFTLTDSGTAAVKYAIDSVGDGSQTCNCDDGGEVQILADVDGNGTSRFIGPMADANDGIAALSTEGRWLMSYNNEPTQEWVPASITIDNVDDPGTITAFWEDQFGNRMFWDAVPVS